MDNVDSVLKSLFLGVYTQNTNGFSKEVFINFKMRVRFTLFSDEERNLILTGIDPDNTVECLQGFPSKRIDLESVINRGCTPWQLLLRGETFDSSTGFRNYPPQFQGPCTICKPLSNLCNLAIKRGCNVGRCVDTIARNLVHKESSQLGDIGNIGHKRMLAVPIGISNDCCYLTLLTVLMKNGVDITPLLERDPPNAFIVTVMRLIASEESNFSGYAFIFLFQPALGLTEMSKICHTFVLYYPGCSQNLIASLVCSSTSFPKEKFDVIMKLHEILLTPRSLKFLAKRSILRAMRQKQVDRLPLPNMMKDYIMEDETEMETD